MVFRAIEFAAAFALVHVSLARATHASGMAFFLTAVPGLCAGLGSAVGYQLLIHHELRLGWIGQSYYAGLAAYLMAFGLLSRRLIRSDAARARAWRAVLVTAPIVYAILKIGCHLDGCCYGRICAYPWAITYRGDDALTALVGFPLHPAQLYAVAHGLSTGAVLWAFSRSRRFSFTNEALALLFLVLFGFGRAITDSFRGDLKDTIIYGLGINTWISLVLATIGLAGFAAKLFSLRRITIAGALLSLALLVLGCGADLPKPPEREVIVATEARGTDLLMHRMAMPKRPGERRILILAMAEHELQERFQPKIDALYGHPEKPPTGEDLVWWRLAPSLLELYDTVIRVRKDHLSPRSLGQALKTAEARGREYDLVLITHGYPNHLVVSRGEAPFSWKHLGALRGKLKHLRMVYMQACFSTSLARDWQAAGARFVLSYPGFTTNYFFYDVLVRKMIGAHGLVGPAYLRARYGFKTTLESDSAYVQAIDLFFEQSVEEYMRQTPMPVLSR